MRKLLFVITLLTSIVFGWWNNVSSINKLSKVENELVEKVSEVERLRSSLVFANKSVEGLEFRLAQMTEYSKQLNHELKSVELDFAKVLKDLEEVKLEERDCNVVPAPIVRLLKLDEKGGEDY